MVTIKDFCNKFFGNYLSGHLFFNQYRAICEIIDKALSNVDLFDITTEDKTENYIIYRCENIINTNCTIIPLLSKIVLDYKNCGWLVSYDENTGKMLFQTFIEVNKKTGVSRTVKI